MTSLHPSESVHVRAARIRRDLLLKYDEMQPRDEDGRWTSGGGFEFVSPNVEENLSFDEASRRMEGEEQHKLSAYGQDVDKHVGLASHHTDAIGDWSDGAENTLFCEIKNSPSYEDVKYSAALKGDFRAEIGQNQKAVIPFADNKTGKDSLYHFKLRGDMKEVRHQLDTAGIQYRTIIPTSEGANIWVFDPGTQMRGTMEKLGHQYDIHIDQHKGTGEFLGGDTRPQGHQAYQAVIHAYEESHPGRNYARAGVPNLGRASATGEVAKDNPNHDDLGRFASADGTIELGGSLNIPRGEMPQFGDHTDDYLQWLKREKGIGSSRETVAPSSLKPSQGTVNTHLMGVNPGGDPPVIISKDSYILNGHHRWYKALMQDKPLEAIRIDTPMKSLLDVSHEYPRVEYRTIPQSRAIAGKVMKDNPNHDELGRFSSADAPSSAEQEKYTEAIKDQLRTEASFRGEDRPSGAKFVLDNGREFPITDKTYAGKRGPVHMCYMNAVHAMMDDPNMTYVEGYVHIGPLAVEHAWVVDKAGNVIDPTLKAGKGRVSPRAYFGVPFDRTYVQKTMLRTKVYGVIGGHNMSLFSAKDFSPSGFGKLAKDGPPDEARDASGKWANSPAALALTPAHPDKEQWPDHIKALKPPPGLEHVRYSMDPKADLQVVGIFPKSGLPKYIYSKEHEAGQQAAKYARTVELDSKWNDVHAQNDDMRKSPDPLVQEHAECAHVVMHTGIRPGSEADAHGRDATYGATTLEGRHVVPHADGSVYLRFKGKAGVKINIPVEDKTAADILTRRAQAAGKDGQLFPNVTENSLLDHVHGFDGGGFKSKDLRTLVGTRAAVQQVAGMKAPTDEKSYVTACRNVGKAVAAKLGNTYAVALHDYINPAVFAPWRSKLALAA